MQASLKLRFVAALLSAPLFHQVLTTAAHCATTPVAAPSRFTATVTGAGPDVILIPGLASSAHVWDATAVQIAATHRVHVIQVAGFAGTPAGPNASGPVVQPLIEELHGYIAAHGLKKPAVIGHSLGGLIGMELAIRHPGDVGRLMVVDSLPFFGMMFGPDTTVATVEPQAAAMRDRTVSGTQEAYAADEPGVMQRLVKSTGAPAQAAIAAASASDHRVVGQAMYDDLTTDLRPEIARIKAPLTMLYPFDADAGMPLPVVDGLYNAAFAPVAGAKLQRIDGSRHFIMIDRPEAFGEAVTAFLR